MARDDSSPSYEQLFGELDFREEDQARSVYSPGAYLVELLDLLEGTSLLERRPDLKKVPLDAEHTFTESPYLDIVNEILERLAGDQPYEILKTRPHPFVLPFDLRNERLKRSLALLRVTPEELHTLFAAVADQDLLARESLGMSASDVARVTTVLSDEAAIAACYGVAALDDLRDVERFSAATGLTGAQVRELRGLDKATPAWWERTSRFIRLARLSGLTLMELDQVLTTLCGDVLDLPAIRVIAAVRRLGQAHDLTVTEVCGLVAEVPPETWEECSGDLLAPRNKDYRHRLSASIGVAESDIVEIVRRYRLRYSGREYGPFDRGVIGLPAITLLARIGRLTGVLGISVEEFFDVVAVLESDEAGRDCYRILEGGDVQAGLWLVRTMAEVVAWMQATGFGGGELAEILGASRTEELEITAIQEAFEQAAFSPETFGGGRFGGRAAAVVHDVLSAYSDGVVSARDERLLRLDREKAETAAYDAVTDLGVEVAEDFTGLGLDERLTAKIYANLVHLGHLSAAGELLRPDVTRLATDFSGYAELLFKMIGAVVNGTAAFFPSDLAELGDLTEAQQAELYGNLIFNGHLTEEGDLVEPGFFLEADNQPSFTVGADLADVLDPVRELLADRVTRFRDEPLALDPEIFAELHLTERQLGALAESLRFNGHLDAGGFYTAKSALLALPVEEFGLALDFYPSRRIILAAMKDQITTFRTGLFTLAAADFAELADTAVAQRVVDDAWEFTGQELVIIDERRETIAEDRRPYQLDPESIAGLGFDDDARARLLALLTARGDLDETLAVPYGRLGYFRHLGNALDFTLPEAGDFAKDVFFLLHAVAGELHGAVEEIGEALFVHAAKQEEALYGAVADATGVPAATAAAICHAVCGGPARAMETLITPLPGDPHFRLACRRIRRFALLAAKLGLDATEVTVAFREQDLTGKFPEPLAMPPGLTRFDALLESFDGSIYLFAGSAFWTYSAATRLLSATTPRPLAELSPRMAGLTVDAAFTYTDGSEWIIASGRSFVREHGGTRWAPREQLWGKIKNDFADPARIDSAFTDEDGRTYLFAGDQFIRYSGTDYRLIDEGFPRPATQWTASPTPIDACFHGLDDQTHVFGDGTWSSQGVTRPITDKWGRVRNSFEGLDRLDAAYSDGPAAHLFARDQVIRYSDSIENDGVRADSGYPRRIADVPPAFASSLDAALVDATGELHLFKEGRTSTTVEWGRTLPALPSGTVDAVFAGLDGRTYLFSGDTYLRYSSGDYTTVDLGFPRRIARDWAGLTTVEAAFVMDGRTYLFGQGGLLFELPPESAADLDAGRVTPALRDRFQEHGLTPTGVGKDWRVPTEQGLTLVIRREGLKIKVYGEGGRFYVRYSTKEYGRPDAGFPKPLSDNWWNLPDSLELGPIDAVFTGHDGRTYLFAGSRYVWFDAEHRWWSQPLNLREHWDSLPFDRVDAAFAGHDGRTYVFAGSQYVRYTGHDHTAVDDRYPAPISAFWGDVASNLARTGRVDATLVTEVSELVDGVETERTYTYLFSGDQYLRYAGADYTRAQDGYPRALSSLREEPGMAALPVTLDGVDAAFADRRNIYLFRGTTCHVVSGSLYRRYDGAGSVGCAFVENGSVVVEGADGWMRRSSLEGRSVATVPYRPRTLRKVPPEFRSGLDAVLTGADGNTYLFKGERCFNVQLNRSYPLAEEWGRPRNTIYHDNAVDAAFVGRDGKTYLFSGDQFVIYPDKGFMIDGDPRIIADHWAGLTSITLAFVRGGKTHLYGDGQELVYSGADYTTPDEGYPAPIDESSWPLGLPDAVLFEGETMIQLAGDRCVSYDERTGRWPNPRPIARLWPGFARGLEPEDTLRAAFTDADGMTWFFFGHHYSDRTFASYGEIRDRWGLSRTPFGRVDAAFVWRGSQTYLFSGDSYVRYSTPECQYVDAGYPKKLAGNLRGEEPFRAFPESFEDVLEQPVDAVIANDRNVYVFAAGSCHVGSREPYTTLDLPRIGTIRNNLVERRRVDASVVTDRHTFLFSGDQYVRYTGGAYDHVDDGYPRAIGEIPEPGLPSTLPVEFLDGIDAAFAGTDGQTYLFKDRMFLRDGVLRPVAGSWGMVRDEFAGGGLDAAFVAPSGELFVFRKGQFARYAQGRLDLAEEGGPRTVKDDWGDLPPAFEAGPDGAFVFDGVTYLLKGEQYVRYSGDDFHAVDRTFPQEFRYRWSDVADYRLGDVRTITSFADLARSRADGLAAFLLDGSEDPYRYLGDLFGWDVDEVRWARREDPAPRTELEFLLRLTELFRTADRAGVGPSKLRELWSAADPDAWDALLPETALTQLHRELNVAKRDALVPTILSMEPEPATSRRLFERLLIDVDMGPEGATSKIREAVAATQLYIHRYLLGLERADADREEIGRWWKWMRAYRLWEANRKVFLYPENYLRPELRQRKTPAFEALENDLLQGEITAETVQRAYKRFLDEYTEVSRLAIAGGYVYTADGADPGERRLVLFGRTRTSPRRYYYRGAEFRDGDRLSVTWDPWLKVDVQIDAERVDPVHAFGRVFVFWPVVETVPPASLANTTITAKKEGDDQKITAPLPVYRVKIYYSFCNLTGEWVPAQVLAVDDVKSGAITELGLYVQASRTVPGGTAGEHDAIAVTCTYKSGGVQVRSAFSLTPELYAVRAVPSAPPAKTADPGRIFAEPVGGTVRFNAPADSPDGPWFSVDHKGGSFLCRPVGAPQEPAPFLPLKGNEDRLPTTWDRIDAAVQLPDGTLVFWDNAAQRFILTPPGKTSARQTRQVTAERWGVIGTNLNRTGVVDAGLARKEGLYLFSGNEYYRFRTLGVLDPGYPKKIETNDENLPRWTKIDAAWTGADGLEYFYSKARDGYVDSRNLTLVRPLPGKIKPDHVVWSRNAFHFILGDQFVRGLDGTPKPLAKNEEGLPPSGPKGPIIPYGNAAVAFDNQAGTYTVTGEAPQPTRALGKVPTAITTTGRVDLAYLAGGRLFLTSGEQFVRYTLGQDGSVPEFIDEGYPKSLARPVQAIIRGYAFSGAEYAPLGPGQELDAILAYLDIAGNWRAMPPSFDSVLDTDAALFFFSGATYAAYQKNVPIPRPFEVASIPHEIIRLTSSTAYKLNRELLTGGVPALLSLRTQETDELPAFSTSRSDPTTIRVRSQAAGVPASSHLDFQSSNGLYYWEIFCHAPLLIAQALNSAQRFEDARTWYEHVFDPTDRHDYWRFLPFLAIDVKALVISCRELMIPAVSAALTPILDRLETMSPAFHQERELTPDELTYLDQLAGTGLDQVRAALPATAGTLRERVDMIGSLHRQQELMGDRQSLLRAYLDDPFDPHAIAELRPVAYRRAVVMAYIDNLLDWGDLLFRQYTGESIDEARMLYIFAYDLLGERPYDMGPRALAPTATYEELNGGAPVTAVPELTAGGDMLEGDGVVHAGVASAYFHVPDNSVFFDYWTRVEDRLRKIRASQDITGVSRPVPLFEPPADVMALVRGAASGADLGQLGSRTAAPVPNYRFSVLFRKAQDLADRVKQLGADLLGAFERRDAEELALLGNRQEGAILGLTRAVKESQVRIAEESLAELRASRENALNRARHYEHQIDEGLTPTQEAQIAMMSMGVGGHFAAGGIKIAAAVAFGFPEVLAGPFIMGTSFGGKQMGNALDKVSEISSNFAEGLTLIGELLGLRAEQERMEEDWRLQLSTARSDVEQLGHQITGGEFQVAVARRELEILNKEIAHLEEMSAFLTGKFAGAQLYTWMSGKLAGLYFQTYNLAYEVARSAERAFQYEQGVSESHIQPAYWESRRNGLLAGEGLGLDLERLGKAYLDADARGLEITKNVSLLALDPMAVLALRHTGSCEFALTEALFDRDFPGHYKRMLKAVSVTFEGGAGVCATLTQLDSRTVLSPDARAVKYLLDPKGAPPDALRFDWRPSQQIALSDDEEGAGLFELRFDDDRYLPFEGSGAISRWRLAGPVMADLADVTITVRYTASQGGDAFATAVRGMLKPYQAAHYLDVAETFPEEWAAFAAGESLVLPIATDLLPGISGRQITGVYASYPEPGVRFLLNGDRRLPLDDGKLLRTPGLTAGGQGWELVLDSGDRDTLTTIGLVLAYRRTSHG
ncbi:hemopexin repeat-containing protein [Nonomuraea sp. NBC_01738]|uniref:Tc toxin subunit A-related protein n=1 Tax=Nonomuraea sp. NBC_01738 TaxID=2976003 RepID=UPI002E15EA6A|nr:hemopexin repeat-containing protein [Nonomuraea sp. NBC_01738]